jgi:hypothetical protein
MPVNIHSGNGAGKIKPVVLFVAILPLTKLHTNSTRHKHVKGIYSF